MGAAPASWSISHTKQHVSVLHRITIRVWCGKSLECCVCVASPASQHLHMQPCSAASHTCAGWHLSRLAPKSMVHSSKQNLLTDFLNTTGQSRQLLWRLHPNLRHSTTLWLVTDVCTCHTWRPPSNQHLTTRIKCQTFKRRDVTHLFAVWNNARKCMQSYHLSHKVYSSNSAYAAATPTV